MADTPGTRPQETVKSLQTLAISEALRAQLSADNLDFTESQLLVDCSEQPPTDASTQEQCARLVIKHERARLRIATVDDESNAAKF